MSSAKTPNSSSKKSNQNLFQNLQMEQVFNSTEIKNLKNILTQHSHNSSRPGNLAQTSKNASACFNNDVEQYRSFSSYRMEALTKNVAEKCNEMREKQLLSEIGQLKEEIAMRESHYEVLKQKYQEKRDEANLYMFNYNDLEDRYRCLEQNYSKLEAYFKDKEDKSKKDWQSQLSEIKINYEHEKQSLQLQLVEIDYRNVKLNSMLHEADKEISTLKDSLAKLSKDKKFIEVQFLKQIDTLSEENRIIKQSNIELRRQLNEKTKEVTAYEQKIFRTEKRVKDLQSKYKQLQLRKKNEVEKQKYNTKQALEGLKLTRKYSQMELNKSRKKQKNYISSQRELISKIKQICKEQSTIETTNDRKLSQCTATANNSLNTTIKQPVHDKNTSPFVSKFQLEESSVSNLSPINKSSLKIVVRNKPAAEKTEKNLSKTLNLRQAPHLLVEIPAFECQQTSLGTPCFENNTGRSFRAIN